MMKVSFINIHEKFPEKRLSQSLFINKVAGSRVAALKSDSRTGLLRKIFKTT